MVAMKPSGLSQSNGRTPGSGPAQFRSYLLQKGRAAVRPARPNQFLNDFGDDPGADRAATFPDREPESLVHGDRLDQLDLHLDVVTGHDHLGALGQMGDAGDVGGAEVELRPVP